MSQFRSTRVEVNGWVVLDKPIGMTSTHAVSWLKRIFNAKKAGHAGTLDPLASGILPIAFGEATKTVPFVQDGEKAYRFEVRWGIETDTDDADGRAVHTSDKRPEPQEIEALLPRFVGEPGDRDLLGRMRQGHLCAGHRPRPRPVARLLRPCHGAAAHPRRAVQRA
jgi:tRNA pseudouridine55 synthase